MTEPSTEMAGEGKAADDSTAPKGKQMRTIVLTGFGGVKMLKTQQKSEPTPNEGEVLIRVKACGLNFFDLMVRQGILDNPPKTPITMGFECSGEVEAVGGDTTGFKVGDRVIGFCDYNAWAEAVVLPAQLVYKMPDNMSYQDGAALAMNYLTAYIMLFDMANLRKGQSVFVHSVGGGVTKGSDEDLHSRDVRVLMEISSEKSKDLMEISLTKRKGSDGDFHSQKT
ncbi:Hypothetical predicted protein [Mytilus galloprovincialis]|uniref:Enoyl reductase (ER) domain-containing protein n=1 Tax=Mytilus galloprovincialis TaxID=29158 RepID=A0A8B6G7U8_MYTGA|nr:Hypothetical predicted protein [Mytilus galloprovincialis]